MSSIQIKAELLHTITCLQGRSFTVAELTKQYQSSPGSLHKGKKSARQFVYRNMLRMIKARLMERLPDDGGWPRYQLTKKFQFNKQANSTPAPLPNPLPKPIEADAPAEKPAKALRERLSKHRSDMLCALGEAEEYQALCKEVPELSSEAQALYNDARERSSILLGKIKALENLLPHQAG